MAAAQSHGLMALYTKVTTSMARNMEMGNLIFPINAIMWANLTTMKLREKVHTIGLMAVNTTDPGSKAKCMAKG